MSKIIGEGGSDGVDEVKNMETDAEDSRDFERQYDEDDGDEDVDYEPKPKREPDALDRFLDRLSKIRNVGFYMSLVFMVVFYLIEGDILLSMALGFICGYAIKWYLLMDDDRRARVKLV